MSTKLHGETKQGSGVPPEGIALAEERPILFSGAMVRAILDGRKTQTRRVVKRLPPEHPAPEYIYLGNCYYIGKWCWQDQHGSCSCRDGVHCRYGVPGDRLWVRETWCNPAEAGVLYAADCTEKQLADERRIRRIAGDIVKTYPDGAWKPSIHMPRWASRITLEVSGVRAQRVQEITEEDAIAEGVEPWSMTAQDIADMQISDCSPQEKELARLLGPGSFSHKATFQMLWDELNLERGYGWNKNPWVWVIEFRRVNL